METQQIVTYLVSLVSTLIAIGYAVLRGMQKIKDEVDKLIARHLAFLEKLEILLTEQAKALEKLAAQAKTIPPGNTPGKDW